MMESCDHTIAAWLEPWYQESQQRQKEEVRIFLWRC